MPVYLVAISLHEWAEGFGKMLGFAMIALWPWLEPKITRFLKKKTDYFSKSINIRANINDELSELRISTGADRACVFEFSNTDKSISNFPFEYINLTFEKTSKHIMEIRDKWQKQHINSSVDFLQLINDPNSQAVILQTDDGHLPENVSLALEQSDIKTCIVIRFTKELRHGFIALHFITEKYVENWNPELGEHKDKRLLKMKAMNVYTLMKTLQ